MLVAAAVSVYGFDEYERAWGRGGSFQVLSWISVPVALGVGLFAALGFRVAGSSTLMNPRVAGALVGLGASTLIIAFFLVTPKEWEGSAVLPILGLCLAVFGLAFTVRKVGRRWGAHAA
jgi:hypothetical protein